jgi:hypothetical protein
MGDHRDQLVDLTTPLWAAQSRAGDVTGWLLRNQWIDDAAVPDELFPTSLCHPVGPRAYERIRGLGRAATITIVAARASSDVCWAVGDSTAPADCPRCGSSAGEQFWEVVSVWSAQELEPSLTCPECGHTAAVGDWDLSGAVAVGSVAVIVDLSDGGYDYAQAITALLTELRSGPGGRWAHVQYHL